jgi:hypothetical protein
VYTKILVWALNTKTLKLLVDMGVYCLYRPPINLHKVFIIDLFIEHTRYKKNLHLDKGCIIWLAFSCFFPFASFSFNFVGEPVYAHLCVLMI